MISVKKMVLVPYDEKQEGTKTDTLSDEIIRHSIPKMYQNKARTVLKYIKGPITRNTKGEMVYEGRKYPETHIADLMRYGIREYGTVPPQGFSNFQSILKELNIPKGLVQQQKNISAPENI